MKLKEYRNDLLGESVFLAKHSSGLNIYIMPKSGYSTTYAIFATEYGSIDTSVKKADGTFETIPEGTAHFLEHKLFEGEELDAFEQFAKTGASANAYTSFDRTAYLFSCNENFEESLGILLDFVQKPYFTQETVEKEQGIIGQEIRMYKDLADWEVMFNLLTALYYEHPVRIDIAGTQESIAKIDADLLYDLYRNFYNLNNMVLCICGNVDCEKVLAVADKHLEKTGGSKIERKFVYESPKPVKPLVEESLSVAQKQFLLGYKEDRKTPEVSLEDELASQIMLEILFGKTSPLFNDLLSKGLVDMGFYSEFFNGFGYACCMIGGTSKDPEQTAEIIRKAVSEAVKTGLDPADFERAKRKLYGSMVKMYNDIEIVSNHLMSIHFGGCKPFAELDACRKLTLERVNRRLRKLKNSYSALSIINPLSQEQ